MRIYNSKPQELIRVNIIEPGKKTRHISFHDCSLYQCLNGITECLVNTISNDDIKMSVQCREWSGSKNGKSISYSLNGPGADKVYDILCNHFK